MFNSYLSTPNFVKKLCEISDGLIGLDDKAKRQFLMKNLMEVNR